MTMNKESGIVSTTLSAIPFLGGALSGGIKPLNGESHSDSEQMLNRFSMAGSLAGPAGVIIGKSHDITDGLKHLITTGKMPLNKANIKSFLLQSLIASGLGSAAGTGIGRAMENKHFEGKYGSDKSADFNSFLGGVGQTAGALGRGVSDWGRTMATNPWEGTKQLGGLAGTVAKGLLVDPAVNAYHDFGDAGKLLAAGDYRAAGGKTLSGLGSAGWEALNFIPGLGLGGKILGGGAELLAGGARLAKATEAADGISSVGKAVSGAMNAPMNYVKDTPVLRHVLGREKLFDTTPAALAPGGQSFLENALRITGNVLKSVGNDAPQFGAFGGAQALGRNLYNGSPNGSVDALIESPTLNKYLGDSYHNQVANLNPRQKMYLYGKLKSLGLSQQLGRADERLVNGPQSV